MWRSFLLVMLASSIASADTPTGRYRFIREVHDSDLSEHPKGAHSCAEIGGERMTWKDGEAPVIEYVKAAHRVLVGQKLFDFLDDDESQVGATSMEGDDRSKFRVLVYVHFWRVKEARTALSLEMDVLAEGRVKCGDIYWFMGSYERL